jgi:cytochrome d ubiquinol oxidase subunit I
MVFGHLTGEYVLHYQPEKFAAIEARWQTQQPATEVLLAIPDPWAQRNLFPIEVPRLGSFIASGDWTAKEISLEAYPPDDRPPVIIPFFAFRIMVGMGLIMVAISWAGVVLIWRGLLESARWFLWAAFLSFPTGFVAVLSGWYTAEVGLQPWVVYHILRTEDAIAPSLTGPVALFSLVAYVAVYVVIYAFGLTYIYRLLRRGPAAEPEAVSQLPGRPIAAALEGSGQ